MSRRNEGTSGPTTLTEDLNLLRQRETGAGFVYFALDLLASRYDLSDAYIVIDLGTIGSQVFRLGGKTTFPARDEVHNAPRGLYCRPSIVSENDARIFYEACAQELKNPRPLHPGINKLYSTESFAPGASLPTRAEVSTPTNDEWYISGSTGDDWEAHPFTYGPQLRRAITRLCVALALVNLVFALLDVHGPLRFVLGLCFGVFVPGWSFVGLLRLRNAGLEIGLSVATSLALIMVCAQVMITLSQWHLVAFEEVLCVATLIPLSVQSTRSWMNRSWQ